MIREKIIFKNKKLKVPAYPIIPYIEGDGFGPDIWKATKEVIDTAIEIAYGGERKIFWKQVYAGEKAFSLKGEWLPTKTLEDIREHLVALKGRLTTPVCGGIRSLNVAIRQELDLFACVKPVKYYNGVPSPVKNPELVDMVIFRENTEDIYIGIEWLSGTPEVDKVKRFLIDEIGVKILRFSDTVSLGVKSVSQEGTKRLIRAAIEYAIEHKRDSVTIVHNGSIMKFPEGKFKDWGYQLAKEEFDATEYKGGPWMVIKKNNCQLVIKDVIADAFLQQIILKPSQYDVIATLNLNGDYISDALATLVGAIGIAPGANINSNTGVAIFEATHGTAPKYTGLEKENPTSEILSGGNDVGIYGLV